MAPSGSYRPKFLRIAIAIIIFGILCIILQIDDGFISKLNLPLRKLKVCNFQLPGINSTLGEQRKSLPLHLSITLNKNNERIGEVINVLLLFAHSDTNQELKNKLSVCLTSLFEHSSSSLHLHIITDNSSIEDALQVLHDSSTNAKSVIEVTLYDVFNVTEPLKTLVSYMQPHFSYKQGAYYSDALFFISIGIFKVLPISKVIMIDIDVKFLADIKDLYTYFDNFKPSAVIGISREQQPVYRHILHEYRRIHPKTRVGAPPPEGLSGFNSGVLLLDLEKMRNSVLYSEVINSTTVLKLVEKYKFKGHLGDQDFYSLVSLDYEELFYILPCTWNRQLCQWWRKHGYEDVFNDYYACTGKIKLVHGNCNTFIPD